MAMPKKDVDFLKLIGRSPDRGEGWRTVSPACWPLIEQFGAKELLEIDNEGKRVRLTEEGENVAFYMT